MVCEPPFIVSVAPCKHPSWLRANWYYKYPEAEFCDDGFSGGSLLGEIGSVHAAVCVVYTYQATLQSALIVSDCQSLFNELRNHRLMEHQSGKWTEWEVSAVLYHLCDMIIDTLREGRCIVFRHKKTFPYWDSKIKARYPPHPALQRAMQDPDVVNSNPTMLPVPNLWPSFPAPAAGHRQVHFDYWRRVQCTEVPEGCNRHLGHFELNLV